MATSYSRKILKNNTNWQRISPDTNHQLSYSRKWQTRNARNKSNEEHNYYIRPFELSVDTMQYLVNTGKLYKITERQSRGSKSANWRAKPEIVETNYLGISDFPSVQIEQSDEIRHTSRHQGFYYDVYESLEVSLPNKTELDTNFLEKGLYYNNLIVKMPNETEVPRKSVQNITYVKNAIESLQAANSAEWTCDLAGIPDKYVFRVEVADTTGKRHMIVGYPSARTMRQYTDLMATPEMHTIHEQMRLESTSQFAELYNYALDKGVADGKITSEKAAIEKINMNTPDNLESEIYKFALGYRPFFYDYNINFYKQLAQQQPYKITPEDASKFETIFNENLKTYYNTIGNRYLNKPLTRIRYTFFIIESSVGTSNLQWVPAVYNIRQLEARHLPILKRIEQLIKLDIPLKFGIISQADYDAGLRYELFHSYYKYVNFFHITTEYLHPMSNFTDYAHNLKDSITLEEIIYSVEREAELGRPFWAGIRFDYKIRNYRLDSNDIKNDTGDDKISNKGTRKYTKHNSRNTIKSRNKSRNTILKPIQGIQILLMYEDTYANYTFIYKIVKDGRASFHKMILKPNLKAIKQAILDNILNDVKIPNPKIKTVYECGAEFIKLLEISRIDMPKNYVIVSDEELKYDDYMNMMWYNPLYVKQLSAPGTTDKINIRYFYETLMSLDTTEYQHKSNANNDKNYFYNIYLEKPALLQNFMLSQFYTNGLDNFNKTGLQLDCSKNTFTYTNSEHYKKCSEEIGIPNCVINCIYYNPGECGYNFIEHLDTTVPNKKKKVIFVIPFEKSKNPYLGNFLDLRGEHLKMLEQITKIYGGQNKLIFLHKLSVFHKFYCIHFHVLDSNVSDSKSYELLYKRIYPEEERAMYMTQELHINNIINNLQNDGNYYKNYNISILSNV